MKWHISAPATTANLGPGYDLLGLALDLRLQLKAEPASSFSLELSGYGHDIYPTNQNNLVLQAYQKACIGNGWPVHPVKVSIHNPIPISSGLGSSAAAIVIGLTLAREVHDRPWDRNQMLTEAIAIEGHPDNVAPAILGGLIYCQNNHSNIIPHRCAVSQDIKVLTATPEEHANTADMRKLVPKPTSGQLAAQKTHVRQLLQALEKGSPKDIEANCHDSLHQPYRLPHLPKAQAVFNLFSNHSQFSGAYLSGSGPTVAGWVLHQPDPSQTITAALENMGLKADLRYLRPDLDGVRRENSHQIIPPAD